MAKDWLSDHEDKWAAERRRQARERDQELFWCEREVEAEEQAGKDVVRVTPYAKLRVPEHLATADNSKKLK